MRYEDASQAGSITTGSEPIARPDVETLAPNSNGPGSGNAISGLGTSSGSTGADQVANGPGTIVELQGAGGAAIPQGDGFQAPGQYGSLTMEANGSFNYVRSGGTPDGVQDVFQYTLADAAGARSSTTLTVEIPRVIDQQAVVNLPAGVQMSDISINGRDLIIKMPDGSQMVIPGGAVFVPELSIGDVIIPPTNLAALLIDSEPQPAAGPPLSGGGNFAVDVPDLDPGVPLGDLIPPTETDYTPPEYEDPMEIVDREPTIIIITPDNPAGAVNAVASVDESGLPERGDEPEGTLEPQAIETTTGTIVFTAEDGLESLTINGTAITQVGQQIAGDHGILTITSINLNTGVIGYSYTATDNTTDGVDDFEDFTVVVTDEDGDVATGSLHIDILDDEPIAEDDTDQTDNQTGQATGNVMTGVGTTSGVAGADTVGADDATLTAVAGDGGSDSSFDTDGNLVVDGAYGTLTIDAEGNYTYVLFGDAPGGSVDVFTYTLTDGDGDPITATLTITNPDRQPTAGSNPVVQLDDDAMTGGNPGGTNDDPNSVNATGTLSGSGGDGDLTFDLLTTGAPEGFTYVDGPNGSILVQQVQDGDTVTVLTITVDPATGEYTVVQNANIIHPDVETENNVVFTINYTVTDADGDVVGSTLTVNVDDDTPLANNDTDTLGENDTTAQGNVITGAGTNQGTGNADKPGADGFGGITALVGAESSDSNPTGGFTVEGEFGSLVMDANGEYTYTRDPEANEGGTDVFTYTYVDGDGDTVTATLTIVVPDINSTPEIISSENLAVDEDGLGTANGDEGQTDPDEDDHGANVTDSGQVVVDYGNDQPANLAGSIEFINPAALNGQLTQGGQPITFSIDGSGNIIGQVNGVGPAVVTIAFTTIVDGAGGQVTYGYQVTLSGQVDQAYPDGDQDEDGITLTGVEFQVTDSDGETDEGSFNVTIFDDVPSADDFEVTQSPEDASIVVDITVGLEEGADGVDLADVTYLLTSGDAKNLSYNSATGEFTYDPDPGETGDVIFTYTVVDGDGDEITQTVTIHLIEDSTPQIGAAPTLTVDEDGLATANGDEGQTDPDEDDHGANVTDSDTVTVDYGSDTPADVEAAFAFINPSSLDGQLTQGGQPITFSIDGSGNIIGQVNGVGPAVVTITMSGAVDNGDGTVDYTYDVTLGGQVDQAGPGGDQDEDGITLTGVEFQVTDSDGTTADGTFDVTIYDDVPTAVDDTDEVDEGDTSTSGNVITGVGGDGEAGGADSEGADGAVVTGAVGFDGDTDTDPAGDFVVEGEYGTLTLEADGSYTYVLTAAGIIALNELGDSETLTDTFSYTLTDADGDDDTAQLVITLNGANDPPTVTGATVRVSEEGLDNGNPDEDGFPDDTADDTNDASITGQVDVGDPDANANLTVTLSDPPSDLKSCGEDVYWEGEDTGTLSAFAVIDGEIVPIMTITIDDAGNYTVTLLHGIDHPETGGEDALDFDITITVDDGTATDTSTLNITVEDDSPVDFTPDGASVDNEAGPESADIPLNFLLASGGDGVGDVVFDPAIDGDTALASGGQTLQFEGEDIHYELVDPYTLEGRNESGDLAFTIKLDPETDSYTIDLEGPIYNISQTSFENVSGIGGGNTDYVALTASTTGATSNDILISGNDSVNTNDNNIGIGNGQDISAGDVILFEFKLNIVEDVTPPIDPTGFTDDGYYQAFEYIQEVDYVSTAGSGDDAASFTVTIANALGAAPSNVTVTIYDGDPNAGGTAVGSYTDNADGSVVVPDGVVFEGYYVVVTSTDPFTSVQYSNSTENDFKLGEIQVEVANTLEAFDFDVPITGTDCDGDPIDSVINITLNPVEAEAFAMMAQESMIETSAKTADLSSASLIPSNDNIDHGRAFNVGNQAALMGVLAAAGLHASAQVALKDAGSHLDHSALGKVGQGSVAANAEAASVSADTDQSAISNMVASVEPDAAAVANRASTGDSADASNRLDIAANDAGSQALSALQAGTDAPSAGPSHGAMTAAAVVMPSADMVAALEAAASELAAPAASVAHNQEVGRVLAEALQGGQGPDIGALLNAATGASGPAAESILDALASLHAGGVSFGYNGQAPGFANGHGVLSVDALAFHHDAPPAV